MICNNGIYLAKQKIHLMIVLSFAFLQIFVMGITFKLVKIGLV